MGISADGQHERARRQWEWLVGGLEGTGDKLAWKCHVIGQFYKFRLISDVCTYSDMQLTFATRLLQR